MATSGTQRMDTDIVEKWHLVEVLAFLNEFRWDFKLPKYRLQDVYTSLVQSEELTALWDMMARVLRVCLHQEPALRSAANHVRICNVERFLAVFAWQQNTKFRKMLRHHLAIPREDGQLATWLKLGEEKILMAAESPLATSYIAKLKLGEERATFVHTFVSCIRDEFRIASMLNHSGNMTDVEESINMRLEVAAGKCIHFFDDGRLYEEVVVNRTVGSQWRMLVDANLSQWESFLASLPQNLHEFRQELSLLKDYVQTPNVLTQVTRLNAELCNPGGLLNQELRDIQENVKSGGLQKYSQQNGWPHSVPLMTTVSHTPGSNQAVNSVEQHPKSVGHPPASGGSTSSTVDHPPYFPSPVVAPCDSAEPHVPSPAMSPPILFPNSVPEHQPRPHSNYIPETPPALPPSVLSQSRLSTLLESTGTSTWTHSQTESGGQSHNTYYGSGGMNSSFSPYPFTPGSQPPSEPVMNFPPDSQLPVLSPQGLHPHHHHPPSIPAFVGSPHIDVSTHHHTSYPIMPSGGPPQRTLGQQQQPQQQSTAMPHQSDGYYNFNTNNNPQSSANAVLMEEMNRTATGRGGTQYVPAPNTAAAAVCQGGSSNWSCGYPNPNANVSKAPRPMVASSPSTAPGFMTPMGMNFDSRTNMYYTNNQYMDLHQQQQQLYAAHMNRQSAAAVAAVYGYPCGSPMVLRHQPAVYPSSSSSSHYPPHTYPQNSSPKSHFPTSNNTTTSVSNFIGSPYPTPYQSKSHMNSNAAEMSAQCNTSSIIQPPPSKKCKRQQPQQQVTVESETVQCYPNSISQQNMCAPPLSKNTRVQTTINTNPVPTVPSVSTAARCGQVPPGRGVVECVLPSPQRTNSQSAAAQFSTMLLNNGVTNVTSPSLAHLAKLSQTCFPQQTSADICSSSMYSQQQHQQQIHLPYHNNNINNNIMMADGSYYQKQGMKEPSEAGPPMPGMMMMMPGTYNAPEGPAPAVPPHNSVRHTPHTIQYKPHPAGVNSTTTPLDMAPLPPPYSGAAPHKAEQHNQQQLFLMQQQKLLYYQQQQELMMMNAGTRERTGAMNPYPQMRHPQQTPGPSNTFYSTSNALHYPSNL